MRKIDWFAALVLASASLSLSLALAAPGDRARFLEGASAARLSAAELADEPAPFLAPGALDLGAIMSPPPVPDGVQDAADIAALKQAAHAAPARWARALADDASVYDRFEKEYGLKLDRKHAPRLIALLNRVSADVLAAAGEAKKLYPRPRPFQRFALARVCGEAVAPKPETAPTTGTSYPSGHAALGWAAALVLTEVAPGRALQLLARAEDYGKSRVVCGVHFPSDVEASRVLAGALIDRLLTVPEFRAAVACAKAERRAVLAGKKSEDQPACQ